MTVFCTDIDNTLIYSHRKALPDPKITAELLNGKEQSFISSDLLRILADLNGKITVIPVTMRTPEQYSRISVLKGICRYAAVCSGAVLLDGDTPVHSWNSHSVEIAGKELDYVEAVSFYMKEFTEGKNFHEYSPFMAYAKTEYPDELKKYLLGKKIEGVNIFSDSRKVYCIAASLDKGSAVKRLKKMFSAEKIISAGDGEQDIPMLNNSDIAVFPEKFSDAVDTPEKIISHGEFLSDELIRFFSVI